MGRFNQKSTTNRVDNFAGGESFSQSPELELVSILLTSFVQNQFYRDADDSITRIGNLIDAIDDKKFVAKTALYARNEFGMRSVSHVVAGEIAKRVKGQQWTKHFFNKIVYRPDDMTEILSYYYQHAKNEPKSLRNGFAQALQRFNEYQLAKYKQGKSAVSLVDVINVCHPQPTEAITKLIKGTLESPETWEVELSNTKGDEQKKAHVWRKLILERKLGYFALLRNLRNIAEQSPDVLDQALEQLCDEKVIKKSLVLPFRFTTALKQIEQLNVTGARKILIALNKALDISLSNVPVLDGSTLVVLDVSGSMYGKPSEIGSLFSAILIKSNDAEFMIFSDDAEYRTINPLDSTITIANSINFVMGGTNFHSIFQTANKAYDRIIILSDMQGWEGYYAPTGSLAEYKTRTGANPIIYSFDLQGYGTMQLPENNVYCLTGFSDKVFDIMKLLEKDKQALIHEIESVEL